MSAATCPGSWTRRDDEVVGGGLALPCAMSRHHQTMPVLITRDRAQIRGLAIRVPARDPWMSSTDDESRT